MAVITVAAPTSASSTSTSTTSIVATSITGPFDAVCVAILTESIVGGLLAVVYRAGFTVAESWA